MKKFFKYKALNAKGKIQSGEISAMSVNEASVRLKEMKMSPIEIQEVAENKLKVNAISTKRNYKLKLKEINIFCRQMETMLSSGVPLTSALKIYYQQEDNAKIKTILDEMLKWIQKGYSLSQSMRFVEGAFPDLLITMVESGEKTGKIDEVLARMATHYEKELKINAKIKNATIYPIILASVTVLAIFIIMAFVIPVFSTMFSNAGMKLPVVTRVVIAISNFIKKFWWLIFIVFGVLFFAIKSYKKTPEGKEYFDSRKLNSKLLKKSMIKIYTARFTRTLSSLLSSGVPLAESLNIASKTTNNVVIENKVKEMYLGVRKGHAMNFLLKSMNIFPKMMISMIAIGEETGELDKMLNKTADYYETELEEAIDKIMSMMEPIMIIIMGAIIGLLVVAIMMPIFQAGNAVQ